VSIPFHRSAWAAVIAVAMSVGPFGCSSNEDPARSENAAAPPPSAGPTPGKDSTAKPLAKATKLEQPRAKPPQPTPGLAKTTAKPDVARPEPPRAAAAPAKKKIKSDGATVWLSASQLCEVCERDKDAAAKNFSKMAIEIEGTIEGLGFGMGAPYIVLTADGHLTGVYCRMIDKEPWSRVAPGQTVKLRGTWPKHATLPSLSDCVIVQAGENPAIKISAEELSRQCQADPGLVRKFGGKYLLVDGQVVSREDSLTAPLKIFLKGAGALSVECEISLAERELARDVKAGQSLKVLGVAIPTPDGKALRLQLCLPIAADMP
jgi:hypothetical protein